MADGVPVNIEEMSDEDFLNMETSEIVQISGASPVEEGNNGAEAETPAAAAVDEEQQEQTTEGEAGAKTEGEEGQGGGDTTGTEGDEGGAAPAKTEEQPVKEGTEAEPKPEGTVPPTGSEAEGKKAEEGPKTEGIGTVAEDISGDDFKALIMAPFKANGRTIQLKSPQEAIQLMQQGANYTRKMMDIQPHRKVLTMLQNADLLDEGKLDFLIGVSKRDPEAIKKLIKDAGIDPLDIDMASEPTYVEGSHLVTDKEVSFNTAVEDLVSSEGGSETLTLIRSTWDQASKDALWEDPTLMEAINTQRSNGLYGLISGEVERLRMLGQIPANTSFIQAYQAVGDHMAKTGGFDELIRKQQAQAPAGQTGQSAPQPVATRVAQPKAKVENDEAARAAAPSRVASKPANVLVNPLAMSDEEFMKTANFSGRL